MENRQSLDSHFKVLIVDDHPNTAHMLARAISRLGSNVDAVAATSGDEAIKHAEEKIADILITDQMMPEMTGLNLIEILSERSLLPAVSFLLTAHDSEELREIALQTNVKRVISKPASPELVCEIVQQAMDELEQSKLIDMDDTGLEPENVESNMPGDEMKINTTGTSQVAAHQLGHALEQKQIVASREPSDLDDNGK